jgi:hypothetical protein
MNNNVNTPNNLDIDYIAAHYPCQENP